VRLSAGLAISTVFGCDVRPPGLPAAFETETASFVGTVVAISTFAAVAVAVTSAFVMHWTAHCVPLVIPGPPAAPAV
jgi:hypothetical protein